MELTKSIPTQKKGGVCCCYFFEETPAPNLNVNPTRVFLVRGEQARIDLMGGTEGFPFHRANW